MTLARHSIDFNSWTSATTFPASQPCPGALQLDTAPNPELYPPVWLLRVMTTGAAGHAGRA
jgi:hypothetical protein